MWPQCLDYSRQECHSILRSLELKAYSCAVDALRASGDLTEEKRGLLAQMRASFNISEDRHKTEVRRAVNAELLQTLSLKVNGPDQSDLWKKEGRRIIPLLPRAPPITGYTQIAEAAKEDIQSLNGELPPPCETRTLRPPPPLHQEPKDPFPEDEFIKPEPVELNGSLSPQKVKQEVKEEPEEDETGLVFLPSGMAVRLREDKSAAATKGGKRKRSVSKSIEIFPKGVPIDSPKDRRSSLCSPPRKISSPLSPVHQAGHGYARPPPSLPHLPQSPNGTPIKSQDPSVFTPLKRGPGRPPGPSSPCLGRGQGSVRTRAPRASRARGPRSRGRGSMMARGGSAMFSNVPVVITQSPIVQGPTGHSLYAPVHTSSTSFRTSTPKVSGYRDVYSQYMNNAGLVSLAQAVNQTHPHDLSTSSVEARSSQASLHTSLSQAFGYLGPQAVPRVHHSADGLSNLVFQGAGQQVSQGVGQQVSQVVGHHISKGVGQQVFQGAGHQVSQGAGQQVSQGMRHLVSQGTGQIIPHGAGQPVSQGQLVSQGAGKLMSQGTGKLVSQGNGQLVSHGAGQLVSHGAGQLVSQGTEQLVSQGTGRLVSQGTGQLFIQGTGNLVTQGIGQLVSQDSSQFYTQALSEDSLSYPTNQYQTQTTQMSSLKSAQSRDHLTASVFPKPQASSLTSQTLQISQAGASTETLQLATSVGLNQSLQLTTSSVASNPALHFSNQTFSPLSSQGLKVISHNTKIVPKSASTVYVMPGTTQRLISPSPRVVTVNVAGGTPRIATPGVSSVIRTIRTSAFPGNNKSVIVVQKSGSASIRSARPNSVALYRPGTPTPRGMRPIVRGGTTTTGVLRIPSIQRPTLIRQQSANGNLYLVELGQEHQNSIGTATGLSNVLTTFSSADSAVLQRIVSKPITSSNPLPILLTSSSSTISKKIIVQAPTDSTKNTDVWLQLNNSGKPLGVGGPETGKISPAKVRLLEVEDSNMSNYSDIFSQALEQANIPVDSPLTGAEIENNLAKTLSATTGRFVTLPPRGNMGQQHKTSVSILDYNKEPRTTNVDGGVKLLQDGGVKLIQDGGVKLLQDRGVKLLLDGGVKLLQDGGVKLVQDGGVALLQNRESKLLQDTPNKEEQQYLLSEQNTCHNQTS